MTRITVTLVVALSLLVVVGGPATAADDELGLSRDGVTWGADLGAPLFDASVLWVPGDSRTASFRVRNQSRDAGALFLDVLGSETDELIETGDLSVSARGAGGDWIAVNGAGRHRLLSEGRVPAGATRQVDVTVSFDPASTNTSQVRSLDLALEVRLAQAIGADGDGASGDGTGGDGGLLPDTGGTSTWLGVLAAVGLLLVLLGVRVARRRTA